MSVVLDRPLDPERPPALGIADELQLPADELRPAPASPAPDPAPESSGTGLKPIERLTSDSRIAKIVPQSDARTILKYSSRFARDFVRSDYNFCASKVTVARNGKLKALDVAFREAGDWFSKAIAWVEKHNARNFPLAHEDIELVVTHPLAGRLVRCLTQYDRLFIRSMEAVLSQKIQSADRENILANAEKRIKHIVQVCIPDNDQYKADGTRRGR